MNTTKIKAFLLADIVGTRTPHFKRETYSTKVLVDLVWGVAKKLGYGVNKQDYDNFNSSIKTIKSSINKGQDTRGILGKLKQDLDNFKERLTRSPHP